jgi:hypothetical protein
MRSEQAPPPRQEQRQVHDKSGFPDDCFLHARAGTCYRCSKQETYAHEFYVSGQKLNRVVKPPRKEANE